MEKPKRRGGDISESEERPGEEVRQVLQEGSCEVGNKTHLLNGDF